MAGGEPGERVGEPGLRIDAIELARFDHAGDHGPMIAAVVRPGEQGILAIQRERTDGTLDRVAVEFDPAIVEEAGQPLPARERIADRLGERALAAELGELGVEEATKLVDARTALLLSCRAALLG